MATIIGSARHDENGKYIGGKAGDQKQKIGANGYDMTGEVSMQYLKDFIGSRKFYILRPKTVELAKGIAKGMKIACNNKHIGYDQNAGVNGRLGIVTYGVDTDRDTESDCGTTMRAVIKYASGRDLGQFTTAEEKAVLEKSGLFNKAITYRAGVKVYEGDVFVTQTKGHTGACVEGLSRGYITPQNFIHDGVDFSRVFDPVYYAKCNPDVVNVLGDNANILFNHFILFGSNEKSRVGRTKADFNVEVYGSHSPDLLNKFGKCVEGNYYPFYRHYCTIGYSETRRTI